MKKALNNIELCSLLKDLGYSFKMVSRNMLYNMPLMASDPSLVTFCCIKAELSFKFHFWCCVAVSATSLKKYITTTFCS